jgi:hypothetical protein
MLVPISEKTRVEEILRAIPRRGFTDGDQEGRLPTMHPFGRVAKPPAAAVTARMRSAIVDAILFIPLFWRTISLGTGRSAFVGVWLSTSSAQVTSSAI